MDLPVEKRDWRISVEAAKPGAAPVVRYTPGPVDLKAYEASHAPPEVKNEA